VGTPAYLAPEVILTTKGKKYDGKVGHAMRAACGACVYGESVMCEPSLLSLEHAAEHVT